MPGRGAWGDMGGPSRAPHLRKVQDAPIVLTSHPAQRRLSFALDDTRYVAVIVLTHLRGDVVPLK